MSERAIGFTFTPPHRRQAASSLLHQRLGHVSRGAEAERAAPAPRAAEGGAEGGAEGAAEGALAPSSPAAQLFPRGSEPV